MKAKYIYAGLIPKDAENEITLTAVPRASLTDFSEISELALDILAQGMVQADVAQEAGIRKYGYEGIARAAGTQRLLLSGQREEGG